MKKIATVFAIITMLLLVIMVAASAEILANETVKTAIIVSSTMASIVCAIAIRGEAAA